MRAPKISLATAAILGCGAVGVTAGAAHAAGTTLFVNGAAGCSDDTTDSAAQPYCSVHAAVAAVQPGQTVQIAAGVYRESVVVSARGTADAPITIAAAPGAAVTIGQSNTAQAANIVDFEHAAYVTLTGVKFGGRAVAETVLVNGSSHVGLTADEFFTGGPLALDVTASDAVLAARDTFQSVTPDGVAVAGGSTATVVTDSLFLSPERGVRIDGAAGTAVTGITADVACVAGVQVGGGSTDTVIENSILGYQYYGGPPQCSSTDANTGDLAVAADSVAGTHAAYNVLDTAASGSVVYRWGTQTFAQAADFGTATGEGVRDIVADPKLSAGQPYNGSPAIDSADSSAVGEQDVDLQGRPRTTDPSIEQTGAGPRSYDDRGALESQDSFEVTGATTVQDGMSMTATITAHTAGFHPAASYTFDFGDGHPVTQDSATISHTFPVPSQPGSRIFPVTISATEAVTGTQAVRYVQSTITYSGPAVSLTASAVKAASGVTYTLTADASGTTAGTAPIASYWFSVSRTDDPLNWPYNKVVTQSSPVLTLPDVLGGHYEIDVTVTDTNGLTSYGNVQLEMPVRSEGAVTVHRISGGDRYQTGVAVSRQTWADAAGDSSGRRTAEAVVLATGEGYADAVAGVPLSAKVHGPLLLTEPGALNTDTAAEITRILPAHQGKTVYVLGGTSAVSTAVENRLRGLGYTVVRFGGADRYATALQIAEREFPDAGRAYLATGRDYADALAAGPLAAKWGAPVLLSDGPVLDPGTANYLAARGPMATAVGGAADAALSGQADHRTLAGADRYGTAAAVAAAFPANQITSVGVATGANFADALTGGAMMAVLGQPLLLTEPGSLSSADHVIDGWPALDNITVFGGPAAISDAVLEEIVQEVQGREV
jgi:putative cell wall-binding protein